MLDSMNVHVRVARRIVTWDDRLLSFQITIGLAVSAALLAVVGRLLESLPWGRLFELFFRLLGVFVFGPHMWLIGRHVRERWAEFVAKSEVYRTGDADVRQAMEQTHERECDEFLTERIQKEIHGSHAEPEVLELQAEMERKYWTVMLRPRPTEPQLRFIHRPDPKRSYAYPTYAAEDRPALQPSGELAA